MIGNFFSRIRKVRMHAERRTENQSRNLESRKYFTALNRVRVLVSGSTGFY